MHLAARGGHLECIKYLVNCGVNLNQLDSVIIVAKLQRDMSALFYAVADDHLGCVKFLVSSGTDINQVNYVIKIF